MPQRDQLLGPHGPAPRFATVFRGYDREQVDAWLRERERHMAEPADRLAEKESDPPLPEPLAAYVLDRARDVARQLPERVMRDAETERKALERAAKEAIETAQTRSAQIVGAARRDRDQLAATVDEARSQIDQLRREASDRARDHVQGKWDATTGALADTELELVGINARRQIILAELGQLERSLDESRAHLRQHGASAVATNDRARRQRRDDHAEPAPERQRSALMPIEW